MTKPKLTWHSLEDPYDNWELRQADGTWVASLWSDGGDDPKPIFCEKLGEPIVTEHASLAAAKRYARIAYKPKENLVKLTIRVPAEMAERIKFLAHDTCESTSHVVARLLAKALHKPALPKSLSVGGVYLTPEILGVIKGHKLNGNKIMAIKAIREYTAGETKDIGLYEAKILADELWTRNDW